MAEISDFLKYLLPTRQHHLAFIYLYTCTYFTTFTAFLLEQVNFYSAVEQDTRQRQKWNILQEKVRINVVLNDIY